MIITYLHVIIHQEIRFNITQHTLGNTHITRTQNYGRTGATIFPTYQVQIRHYCPEIKDISPGMFHPKIPGSSYPLIRLRKNPNPWILFHVFMQDLRRMIRRTIIYTKNFNILLRLMTDTV